ncbi:MAG: hypothetical protein CMH56_12060 [Myxococcales bacterium]|nr:hypothetical protein [Myxococcales bacterium]|tara:strand:- start:1282 stop:3114 length:1833 start_codon:yes stop_codon:yes gene_type:complete
MKKTSKLLCAGLGLFWGLGIAPVAAEELKAATPTASEDTSAGVADSTSEESVGNEAPETAAEPEVVSEPAEEEEMAEVEVNTDDAGSGKVTKALFRKGELTDYGTTQILARRDFAGLGFGVSEMDGYRYLVISPDFNLIRGKLALGVGFPLRLEVGDLLNEGTDASFAVRPMDWDELSDLVRPLRYFTWGRKEDNFYIDINRVHAATIGHGQLLRNYIPNLDIDEDRLYFSADAYGDYGGFEFLAGALPMPQHFGALAFIKPMSFFTDDKQLQSLSLGLSYVGDLNAPTQLDTVAHANPHDTDEDGGVRYAVNDQGNFLWAPAAVHGVGVDGEFKVYKRGPLDIKVYADYSHLFLPAYEPLGIEASGDGGFTVGSLFRISKGARLGAKAGSLFKGVIDEKIQASIMANHAFRIRLEGKTFGPRFLPSYFNSTYSIQKLQMGFSQATSRLPTKLAYLSMPDDESQRLGGYLELSYRWMDNIGLTAIYEDAFSTGMNDTLAAGRQVVLHAESQSTSWAQMYVTYHYFTFENIGDIFKFETDNELLFAGARIQILPFLFLNAMTQRTFGIQFTDEDLLHRRNLTEGGEQLGYTSLGLNNAWTHTIEAQLGWQY